MSDEPRTRSWVENVCAIGGLMPWLNQKQQRGTLMPMNAHDYQPVAIREQTLDAIEQWADLGSLTPNQIQLIMDKCEAVIKEMWQNVNANEAGAIGHMGKAEKQEHLLRCIATLDRLHAAVKLNHERIKTA